MIAAKNRKTIADSKRLFGFTKLAFVAFSNLGLKLQECLVCLGVLVLYSLDASMNFD